MNNSAPANSVQSAIAANAAAHTANGSLPTSTATSTNGTAPEKPKRQRKKKEVPLGPDGKPIVEEKPKKPRKPREPKDKAAGT